MLTIYLWILKIYPPGPNSEGFTLRIFQIPDAEAIILSLQFSLQNKKINDFVFFNISVLPIISSPTFEEPINFKSNDIVTHGELFAAR